MVLCLQRLRAYLSHISKRQGATSASPFHAAQRQTVAYLTSIYLQILKTPPIICLFKLLLCLLSISLSYLKLPQLRKVAQCCLADGLIKISLTSIEQDYASTTSLLV